ncbi:site-specific integrase [Polyangium jinanense]|uniref:Site-specific integrase n=1 Tax=Polyangium jinanense TaxID=2829994 RepID=A0A9X4AXF1_9BACT|nr:site-specific integrase [Polyangium jinanense]
MTSTTTNDGTTSRGGRPITGEACFRANGYEIRITLAGKRTTIRLAGLGRVETPEATARAGRYREVIATLAREGRALPLAALESLARSLAALPETRLDAAREALAILLGAGRPAGELAAVLSGIVAAPTDDAARAAIALARLAAEGRAILPEGERSALDWIPPGLTHERAALLAPSPGTLPGSFGHLAELFLSGRLAAVFPGRVHKKTSYAADRSGLRHVLPALGRIPCRALTLDHGEAALSGIPDRLGPGYVRSIASSVRHLLSLAVYPLRWTETLPLPAKWVPRAKVNLERQILMPAEEHTLLACTAIPLCLRVFVAWQARQGTRLIDAERLTLSSLTFQGDRATVRLAKTKDNDPRSWALDPADTMMIRAWIEWRRKRGENLTPTTPLFPGPRCAVIQRSGLAQWLRSALWDAGIRRAALFTRSAESWPHEEHDLRALFCTYSLAKGRALSWITDRTGHSLQSLETYRRHERRWSEMELGDLAPSVQAIPELAALAGLDPLPPPPLPGQPGDLDVRPITAERSPGKVLARVSAQGRDRRGANGERKGAAFPVKSGHPAPSVMAESVSSSGRKSPEVQASIHIRSSCIRPFRSASTRRRVGWNGRTGGTAYTTS